MKRLIIVCEGETEQEFCQKLLQPHLNKIDIYISTPIIEDSGGGIVPWETLKRQLRKHLSDRKAYVTTFIDYYGIPDKFNYPKWESAKSIVDKKARMVYLEQAMYEEFNNYHFIPYIQLHEFEALLFNNIESFEDNLYEEEFKDKEGLEQVFQEFENPELINNGSYTAPSKRLNRYIHNYKSNKILYGVSIAESIGLSRMREKCPHFNEWIEKLESLANK